MSEFAKLPREDSAEDVAWVSRQPQVTQSPFKGATLGKFVVGEGVTGWRLEELLNDVDRSELFGMTVEAVNYPELSMYMVNEPDHTGLAFGKEHGRFYDADHSDPSATEA